VTKVMTERSKPLSLVELNTCESSEWDNFVMSPLRQSTTAMSVMVCITNSMIKITAPQISVPQNPQCAAPGAAISWAPPLLSSVTGIA
jgi:hypothetical protein